MSLAALVGRLGSAPLAAVGLSGALFNFCNFLFSFLMVVTTPRVAAAVAQKDLGQVRPQHIYSYNLSLHQSRKLAATLVDSASRHHTNCKFCMPRHDDFVLQASRTTAQGLWLATGCGVIVGLAIYLGGPFAVAGSLSLRAITLGLILRPSAHTCLTCAVTHCACMLLLCSARCCALGCQVS